MGNGNPLIMPRSCNAGIRDGTCGNREVVEELPSSIAIDEAIKYLIETRHSDSMRIQRLKKRKLRLKDMITKLESELIPNLDA